MLTSDILLLVKESRSSLEELRMLSLEGTNLTRQQLMEAGFTLTSILRRPDSRCVLILGQNTSGHLEDFY